MNQQEWIWQLDIHLKTLGPVPGELDIRGIWTFRDKHSYQTTASSQLLLTM